jgi:hypothetical protein
MCPRVNLPKEDCYKDCELLQTIQNIELSKIGGPVETGPDYSENSQFTVNRSAAKWISAW